MNIYVPGTGFATQGPCPDGFHIPTKDEWDGVFTITDSLGITTGDSMRIKLHLPFGGIRNSDTTITNQGGLGYYWISAGSTSGYAYDVCFGVSVKSVRSTITRTVGEAIRPFKDSFVVPASGWTVIQGTLGSAGIFWNQTEGIISITSNGNTGYTISDKNCGATTVYSDGDTLSQANMGNMYQRGNNYGFPSTGNISNTSSTAVNAGSYGPGNYYSSSTWITAIPWDSSDNYNLRGGTDGNVPVTTMEEVSNIYIGEYKEREPDSNTIVYWKLNGDAKDSSGNHRDGTVSGNLTYESIGSIDVAKFTGSQEVYRSGSEFTLGGNHPFTFSVWIKPTSLSNTVPIATIQKSDYRGTRDKELVVQSNGSFYGYFYSGGANYIYDNTGEVTTSHWNYLTFTFNGSTLKLYLNGTLKNTVTPTSGSYTLASPKLVLSSYYYRGSYRYSGYMSNFILQNNAWDASYISNYFNTYKGLYGLS